LTHGTALIGVMLLLGCVSSVHAQVKAFPTAEGFGASSVGGRGGRVIKVTNLNDSGDGSLRACMENTGARTCIFEVGGTIRLNSNIKVTEEGMSYLTVAGQTAPGGGIQITNFGLWFTNGVHDIILRHLRIRHGHDTQPPLYQNGFNFLAYNGGGGAPSRIILDHLSLQWAPYVSHEYSGAREVTTQWSLIGVGENSQDYVDPQGNPALSMGAALGGYNDESSTISFHHNLLTSSEVRQPLIGQGATVDYVNNIAFNWYGCDYGFRVHDAGNPGWQVNINLVNNRWIPGPASCTAPIIGSVGGDPYPRMYVAGSGSQSLAAMGLIDQVSGQPISESIRESRPFPAPPITLTPMDTLESVLVASVGATKPARDSLDTLYLGQFSARQGGGGTRCSRCGQAYPSLAGGQAPQDSDGDGMPDAWEAAHGLNAQNGADGAQVSETGYTHLEHYLHELAEDGVGPPIVGRLPPPTQFRIVVR
jgi:pectate lyase